jgi:acyl carrier protein
LPGPTESPLLDSPPAKASDVLADVVGFITQVLGADYVDGMDIDLDTSFNTDLEIESIEFVALSEVLREHYGDAVDFVAWIADMDVDEIIALTVGELVEFIEQSTS